MALVDLATGGSRRQRKWLFILIASLIGALIIFSWMAGIFLIEGKDQNFLFALELILGLVFPGCGLYLAFIGGKDLLAVVSIGLGHAPLLAVLLAYVATSRLKAIVLWCGYALCGLLSLLSMWQTGFF